jgi:hypothetical protein
VVTARHGLTDSVELAAAGIRIPRAQIMCRTIDIFKTMSIPPKQAAGYALMVYKA